MRRYFEDVLEKMIAADLRKETLDISAFGEQQLKYYPKYLYKYRTCDKDHNFDMITQEYLWADIPENFSDPYDSLIHLKFGSELPVIQSWLYQHIGEILYYSIPPKGMKPHKNGQTLKLYRSTQEQFFDVSGRYNAKKAQRLMLVELNKLPQNERLDVQRLFEHFESDEFQKILEEAIYNSLVNVINALRRKVKVCCVTTRRDNRNMWENYAAQYAGFVIEYKTENALKRSECVSTLAQMFPVTYYKRFPKVPLLPFIQREFDKALYNRERDILPSIKQLNKQLVSKKYDYRAEEEWRILTPNNRIEFPLISAVYAGYRIREEDLNRLGDCCKLIGVPLYKQQLGVFDDLMRYEQVL